MSLRLDELSRAERPFHARGSKVIRCDACLLPAQNCICEFKPEAGTDVAVLFLMYKGEYYKPTNTGRLIADVVKDNHAFLWRRTEPDEALLKLLSDDKYFPIVVITHPGPLFFSKFIISFTLNPSVVVVVHPLTVPRSILERSTILSMDYTIERNVPRNLVVQTISLH